MTTFFRTFLAVGQDGLRLIATAVLPVLFPFFVITSLILNLTNATHPWLVSVLAYCSGYPNGARLTQDLYSQQRISLPQAQQLIITTSTPSPFFVIATAGVVFLHEIKLGCAIFLCAIIGAILNGYLWRPTKKLKQTYLTSTHTINQPSQNILTAFSNALTSATNAIVNACGIVLFFYIAARLCLLPPIIAGLLEMTTGVATTTNPLLIQFFVTFGGLSVAMQQQIFMQKFQIKFYTYFAYKFTHAVLACGLLSVYLLFLY